MLNVCKIASTEVSNGTQKYYLVIRRISGIGNVMFMYGSKVTEILQQSGH
jgi:hypothetical protein